MIRHLLRLTSISFLLARLAMDILAPTTIKNLRQIKRFLVEKSLDLSEMYQATYSRIKSSDTTTADLARRVILWICYAQRPLHETELQHAIATELEDEDFDPDGITPGDLLRSSCMGLVTCDDERMYSLFHLTAYEFFRSNLDMSSDASHLLISRTCLTYLSFPSTGRQGSCTDLATLEARKSEFRFLDYAAKHGADHIRQVEAAILEEVASFLHDDTLRYALMQAFYHRHRDDEDLRKLTFDTLPSGSSPLQVACGQGLLLTAEQMLQAGADPKVADLQGWTPLITATSYGRLDVLQLLLSYSKDLSRPPNTCVENEPCNIESDNRGEDFVGLNQPDNDGWTPLFWAIIKNQYQAAELLLIAGSKVNVLYEARWTPIEWAAFKANRDFVDLILRFTPSDGLKGPSRTRRRIYRPEEFTPLFVAAAAGDYQTTEAMLKFGFGTLTIVELNLHKLFKVLGKEERRLRHYIDSFDVISAPSLITTGDFSVKLLESAIRLDQRIIVKMLIELGASLGAMKSEIKQRTPLHVAACCGHYQICEYLLLKGASSTLRDADGFTAMDLAIMIGHPQCTRLFLTLSPPPSSLVERGISLTAFVFGLNAAGSGNLESSSSERCWPVFRDPQLPKSALPMLGSGVSDSYSVTLGTELAITHRPLYKFIDQEHYTFGDIADVLQALLGFGCDPKAINECWHTDKKLTALHQACSIANLDLILFLAANGADVNQKDYQGRSPLHIACDDATSDETIQQLLQHGADINAQDNRGRSVLYAACNSATIEIVQYLVVNGAVVKAYGDDSFHPLHAACNRRGYDRNIAADTIQIIDYILSCSDLGILSMECRPPWCEGLAVTPLHLAIRAGNWGVVEHLQALGANITDPRSLSIDLWDCAEDARGQPFRCLFKLGASPAGKCPKHEDKTIIAHYFDKFVRWNETADERFEENLEALRQAGADINACSYFDSSIGSKTVTVLLSARGRGLHDSFVQVLLRHGAVEDEELEGE
jgi:ankyrin repeat protein